MKVSFAVFFILISLGPMAYSQTQPQAVLTSQEAPRIQGYWKSETPRVLSPGIYFTQEMQFTLGRWERTTFFSNTADMKKIVLIARSEGPYELKKASDPQSPWQLDLKVSRRVLKSQHSHAALTKALNVNGCSLSKKDETEINKGCGIFPAIEKCPTEFQSVDTKDGKLRVAAPTNGTANFISGFCESEKRATLLDYSLTKIN